MTNTLKRTFEYPRPVFLSAEVGEPGDTNPPPTIFDGGGGAAFWSLPEREAVEAMRKIQRERGQGADGLPSGHVASAAALSFSGYLRCALFFSERCCR